MRRLLPCVLSLLIACGGASQGASAGATTPGGSTSSGCGKPLRVRFFDVGQSLAALVTLPDGKLILVDAGPGVDRAGCGDACEQWHDQFFERLYGQIGETPIYLLWLTHLRSDDVGGAAELIHDHQVIKLAYNGVNTGAPAIASLISAAEKEDVNVHPIDGAHRELPVQLDGAVKLTPIAPAAFSAQCADKPEACSIGLRIDYCASSLLFTGDVLPEGESALEPLAAASVLQVGAHGADGAASEALLAKVRPKYAVISVAKPGEGTNSGSCTPAAGTVKRLSTALGDSGGAAVNAFAGACGAGAAQPTAASSHLLVTARDGDVVLETTGDGDFRVVR